MEVPPWTNLIPVFQKLKNAPLFSNEIDEKKKGFSIDLDIYCSIVFSSEIKPYST